MKKKILTIGLALLATSAQHANGMAFGDWWDDIDEMVRQQRNNVKEYIKQFEWADVLRSITKNTETNKLELEFNFAGFDKDEISITIENGVLKVNAERKKAEERDESDERQNKKCLYRVKELSQKTRAVDLKKYNVDLDDPKKIESSYKNGILKIEIPLKTNAQGEIKIKIKESEPVELLSEPRELFERK